MPLEAEARELGRVTFPRSLPLPIISAAGGYVGGFALVTVKPIGLPATRLPLFFLRIILRWVGLVMLRKY